MKHLYIFLYALGFALSFNFPSCLYGEAIKVEVVLKDGQWVMLRDGEPYFIKGAGGSGYRIWTFTASLHTEISGASGIT